MTATTAPVIGPWGGDMGSAAERLDGRLIGPYRLIDLVERSEYTEVYRAEHTFLGGSSALKLLHPGLETPLVRGHATAAQLQARVVHPNVVRATDGGLYQGRPYVVMDWVDGESLSQWLDSRGAFSLPRGLGLFLGLIRGLHAIHRAGVVHRDLKPCNVLLELCDGELEPRILDFGLAKGWATGQIPVPQGLSVEFRTLGTPEYMAPEQSGQAGYVDARADLFSAGVILYELLADARPFEADEGWRVMGLARLGHYKPLRHHRPDVSESVEQLVADLLAPDPSDRLTSSAEVLGRLDLLIDSSQ